MRLTIFTATLIAIVLAHPIRAATVSDQSVIISESSQGDFSVLSGTTATNWTALTLVTPPAHGTLQAFTASGVVPWIGMITPDPSVLYITYTPTPLYVGNDSFVWNAADTNGSSSNATFTITVNPNSPPTANSNGVVRAVFKDTDRRLVADFTDADTGQIWTLHVVTPPHHGTAIPSAPSSYRASMNFTYTPAAGYTGSDSFTWTVDDAVTTSNAATCTLLVRNDSLQPLTNSNFTGFFSLLLTDGTVISFNGTDCYRLTPDASGSYVNGAWSQLASSFYSHVQGASVVLRDGRVFLAGGENPSGPSTAEIYDPVANTWTLLTGGPVGSYIADSTAKVMPDGRVLLLCPYNTYGWIYNPDNNSWTTTSQKLYGDINAEESFIQLPDGSFLTVGCLTAPSQKYIPALDQWVDAGNTPVSLTSNMGNAAFVPEIGPGLLLYDGRALFLGASLSTGHTAFYTPPANPTDPGIWAAGPDIPDALQCDDAVGAVMPNGHVLFAADGSSSSAVFEFDPVTSSYIDVPAYPGLVLPTGQLFSFDNVYTPAGSPNPAWRPTISTIAPNSDGSFLLTGTQLNGLTEGGQMGDDLQFATNYPIVRLVNGSGRVYYARTFNHSSMGVATGSTPVSTNFTVAGIPNGNYSLYIVANGIASDPISFTVGTSLSPTITSPLMSTATVGSVFGYPITATNSPTSFNATGLPAGLIVNNATGIISGTPMATGTSSITLSATNAAGTGIATLTLTVSAAANQPPVITSAATATPNPASVGQSVTLTVGSNDPDGDTLTYSWAFGDATGGSGASTTHAYATAGTYTASVTVSDGRGSTVNSNVAVVINGGTGPSGSNMGFETPGVGPAGQYASFGRPTGAAWTFAGYSSGISANGSGYTAGNPNAPEGVQVAYLQGAGSSISQSIEAFQAGASYTVVFAAAQRGNYNHGGQDFQVFLDNTLLGAFTPAGTSYADLTTAAVTPGAGTHTLKFIGLDTVGGDNTAFIDNVRITVSAGGPSGSDMGFETPAVSTYQYNPTGTAWTFAGGSGVSANGTAFTSGNPNAPEGVQVAFLQNAGSMSQSIDGFQAGVSYTVVFAAAQRGNYNHGGQDFQVFLDNTSLGTFTPASASYADLTCAAVTPGAGTHTLKFVGLDTAGDDNTAFIDNVRITVSGSGPSGSDMGFETPAVGTYQYNPTGMAWTFAGGSGVSANGNAFTSGNPNAPEGVQVAFLQGSGSSISQSIGGFQAGASYTVVFAAAQRGNWNQGGQNLNVLLDNTLIGSFNPLGATYADLSTYAFTPGAGTHTLSFVGLNSAGGDNTAFIDNVRIYAGTPALSTPEVNKTIATATNITDLGSVKLNQPFKLRLTLPANFPKNAKVHISAGGLPLGVRVRGGFIGGRPKQSGAFTLSVQFEAKTFGTGTNGKRTTTTIQVSQQYRLNVAP
jgi:hypothetical protein